MQCIACNGDVTKILQKLVPWKKQSGFYVVWSIFHGEDDQISETVLDTHDCWQLIVNRIHNTTLFGLLFEVQEMSMHVDCSK